MSAVDGIDEFAAQLAGILKEKNAAYGDSFARVPTILAGMYEDVPPEVLEGILFNARIQDKLGRIAKDPLAAGEDAYMDLAGYALLMANVQRLKREAKPKSGKAQREAMRKHAGSLPGINIDSIYDEPDDGEAPAKADAPAVVPASEWIIKRGDLFLCKFEGHGSARPEWSPSENSAIRYRTRRDADFALAHHLPGAAKGVAAEAPSEPNGRAKRDMANAEVTQEPTGWYIVCFEGRDRQFFNDFGGFWIHDIRDATSFLSQEAADLCLRRREASCE